MLKEIRVNVKPLVKKLDIQSKKNVFGEFTGEYRTHFKGRGLDFDGFRDYLPQDDASMIDWKASLRAQQLLVRVYKEERNLDIYILFDTSTSMCFSSTDKLKCEFAAEVIANLAFGAIQVGDNVSLIAFNEEVKAFLPPKQGKAQFNKIVSVLSDPKNYFGKLHLEKAISALKGAMTKPGVIIIVSDFIGFPDNWNSLLAGFGKYSKIMGIMIRDPRDDEIPKEFGELVLSGPYTTETVKINTWNTYEKFKEEVIKQKEDIIKKLKALGGNLLEIKTTEPFDKKLKLFFARN